MKRKELNPSESDAVIRMAWHDRTSFDEIQERTGLSESEVIRHMRGQLKPSSFRMWRKRVSGRITKHRKRFKRRND
ncbi:MAG: TIGR03643 family protein [Akkermansiaceae bacterium]|nr:TIGR03643 family protein [Akkermansiaceae bacterium]